jgi:hypothetical protein
MQTHSEHPWLRSLPGVEADILGGDCCLGASLLSGLPLKKGCVVFAGLVFFDGRCFFCAGTGSGIRSSPSRILIKRCPTRSRFFLSSSAPYRSTTTRLFGGSGSFTLRGRPRLLGSMSGCLASSFPFPPGELSFPPALSFIIFFGGVVGGGIDVTCWARSASIALEGGIETCGEAARVESSVELHVGSLVTTESVVVVLTSNELVRRRFRGPSSSGSSQVTCLSWGFPSS